MRQACDVISRWHHLFENCNLSAQEFYVRVEQALKSREVPGVAFSRVEHSEGGVLSAKREYLRVSREKLTFDICAAPYSKGFFFSWWLVERPLNPFASLLGCLGLVVVPAIVVVLQRLSHVSTFLLLPFVPITWWVMGSIIRVGAARLEDAVLSIPCIDAVYVMLFKPVT